MLVCAFLVLGPVSNDKPDDFAMSEPLLDRVGHAEPVAKDAGQVRKWIDAAQCAAHSHREVAEVVDMQKASDEMKHKQSAN